LIVEQRQVSAEHAEEKVLRLADIDTSIAIIEVWRRIEQAIIGLVQHNGLVRFTAPAKFMEHLATLGKLTPGDIALFRKLRDIRNASVHGHDRYVLSKAEVLEFSTFVDLLIGKLDEIKQQPGYIDVPRPPVAEHS
jgi:hypothetical protein